MNFINYLWIRNHVNQTIPLELDSYRDLTSSLVIYNINNELDNSQNIVSRDSKPFYSYDSNSFNNSREKSNPNKSFDSAIFSNPKYVTEEPNRLKSYS